jgi:transcription initiation factor IIF auxiliary subunit
MKQGWGLLAAGGVALVVVLGVWEVTKAVVASRGVDQETREASAALNERVQQISVLLNVISEQQLLSDRAKSVAFREKDSEALRRAIREEIAKTNYEGAVALVDDMERAFGYKAEADQFRNEITQRRDESMRRLVAEAMTGVDKLVREERWPDAFREAERLRERFPTLESVKLLPKEIEMRREAHKKQLLVEWNDSVRRHDPDASIATLKRLDPYLTPTEAEQMQETVRGVFKEKLNGLRTQFSLAVQDHHWADAIRLGETIMRDFPNSRLAAEVKETMDALRQHAAEEPAEEAAKA